MATEATKIPFVEAAAPATPAAGRAVIYAKADGLMYSKDDAGVETLMSSGAASGIPATILDAKGDLIAASAADTAAKLTAGTNGRVLVAASGETTGLKWAGGLYFTRRLMGASFATPADTSINVNSTTYVGSSATIFLHDWDAFPATHFFISVYGFANEASQTVSLQLASAVAPTTPYSAGGNDLVMTNNGGASQHLNSGWVAVSGTPTGLTSMCISLKGSTATVDLTGRWMDVGFKVA